MAAASPARAHAHLVRSRPAADTTVSAPPAIVELWFSEAPEIAVTRVMLVDARGTAIPVGPVARDAADRLAVVLPINAALTAGRYTVRWRTAGVDGHPTHGEFGFTVAAHVGQRPAATAPESPAGLDASSPGYVAARWFSYTALACVIGAVTWYLAVRRVITASLVDETVRRAAMVGVVAAIALVAGALARLVAQRATLSDVPMRTILAAMVWGRVWLVHVSLAIAAVVAFAMVRWGAWRARPVAWGIATAAVIGLAFTPALAGHAASAPGNVVAAVVADGLHVLGSGAWLGTLAVLLTVGVPAARALPPGERGAAVAAMVNAFSPVALTSAAIVGLTGIYAAWHQVGTLAALIGTAYGRVLDLKLVILSLLIGSGFYNWRVVRPMLAAEGGTARLRRSASAELVVGAVVFAVTAVLVAMPTPKDV
jgi:copper transport protein